MNETLDLEVDGIHAIDCPIIGVAIEVRSLHLIERLLGEAGIRDRRRFEHRAFQNFLSKHRLHEADHLCLWDVRGLISRDEIAQPVQLDVGASILDITM